MPGAIWPLHPAFLEDPNWYDTLGQDLVKQRRIWARASESEQVEEFHRLLAERPGRGLDMLSVDTRDDIGGTPLMRACAGKRAEIVGLLIDAGADIFVRQKGADPDGHEEERTDVAGGGANAFELAALGGSIECAEPILGRAEQLGTPRAELVTALALASAAQSDDLDMLGFVLDAGGFPRPLGGGEGGGSAWETDALTDGMKEKIEKAFARTLQAGKYRALRPLLAYIGDSHRKASSAAADGGEPRPYWTSLSGETLDSLNSALWDFAGHDDDEHLTAFGFVYDVYLDPGSRLARPAVQERRAEILDEAFFWAAQHDCVRAMRLVASRHERLNVNHLSRRRGPYFTTALYMAAGSGHAAAVEYLLAEHGERLDVHMGVGKFANSITALGKAVWNGHHNTARLLLERAGGPVEFSRRGRTTRQRGKSCRRGYAWGGGASGPGQGHLGGRLAPGTRRRRASGGEGDGLGEDRNEVHYVVIQLEEADAA
ncbi:hypothetical protein DL765_011254 [Monosporascus sp. GIB2]|nr:hypothetical protein DL765_011254 [Monosporascus sp. GIB2]